MIEQETMIRLERQAALSLTDTERTELANQMNAVLSCLDVLRTHSDCPVPTEQTAAPLRTDEVRLSTDRAALLSNAPESDGDFFLVPRTVE